MITLVSGQEGESILDALENARVFSISKKEDKTFTIIEECDRWFGADLNIEQMLKLSDEIRELASKTK